MMNALENVNINRVISDTLDLVHIPSATGNTLDAAARYEQMLREVGCTVERYEFIPNNPTLVAVYGEDCGGKSILFNGHMDVVPLAHDTAEVKDGRIYGRGACDMKGSLACILEVVRILHETNTVLPGKLIIVANSLHESPGGRGEDLYALTSQIPLKADLAVVMEGASVDCTIAQLGSATFEITVEREGDTCHQLYAAPNTPHPITIAAEVVRLLDQWNIELEKEWIEDIGYASFFVGSLHSGQFYNQLPNQAVLVGVRRYDPHHTFENVEQTLKLRLDELAEQHGVQIHLDMLKVRDGYRIDKHSSAVAALQRAVSQVRKINLPLVGKKVVTDAGILANALGVPVLCCGPDQHTAHGDVEYVEINELEITVKVYLKLIEEFMLNEAT
ncbi:M20 family metallopeptidase [Paenibacillus sp. HWE-109]|uniref:M20 family metallopeptidase n=1 Tax=Paenibacillus sp. HWE-109 TaxID=1306526 RepID=UPI001EDF6492|nr:M20 family metallopeptidase [Paenibacillus sp. HWE-109]UKS29591.1 M20 family metallopeptidase [Paenibacillus sp. HWE-109]